MNINIFDGWIFYINIRPNRKSQLMVAEMKYFINQLFTE